MIQGAWHMEAWVQTALPRRVSLSRLSPAPSFMNPCSRYTAGLDCSCGCSCRRVRACVAQGPPTGALTHLRVDGLGFLLRRPQLLSQLRDLPGAGKKAHQAPSQPHVCSMTRPLPYCPCSHTRWLSLFLLPSCHGKNSFPSPSFPPLPSLPSPPFHPLTSAAIWSRLTISLLTA
jgi:hypothetical protein